MVLLHAGEYKAWNTLGMGDNSYHHQEIINDMMLTNEALHFGNRESREVVEGFWEFQSGLWRFLENPHKHLMNMFLIIMMMV